MKYYYSSQKDTNESKYWASPYLRGTAMLLCLVAFYFINKPISVFLCLIFAIVFFVIQYAIHRYLSVGEDFISIKNDKLSWKSGKDKKKINLNSVSNWQQKTSHFLLITHTGDKHLVPSFIIENKGKFEELISLLNVRLSET